MVVKVTFFVKLLATYLAFEKLNTRVNIQVILETTITTECTIAIEKCTSKRFIAGVRIKMGKHFVGISENSSAIRKVTLEISLLSQAVVWQNDVQGELCWPWNLCVNVFNILGKVFAIDNWHFVIRVDIVLLQELSGKYFRAFGKLNFFVIHINLLVLVTLINCWWIFCIFALLYR